MLPSPARLLLSLLVGAVVAAGAVWAPLVTSIIVFPAAIAFCAVRWKSWRVGQTPIGGAPALIFVAGVVAYVIGSVRLADEAPYANGIPEQQWTLYLWAGLAAALGIAAGAWVRLARPCGIPPRWTPTRPTRTYPAWAVLTPTTVGLIIAWINFVTGDIPLLADSINEARRSSSGAVLAQWSFASYPTLEFVIVAAVLLPVRRFPLWARITVVAASTGTLLLTGSRSFLVFPIIAIAFAVIESRRPRLVTIAGLSAALVVVVGVAGQLRSIASGTGANLVDNAEKWGYGPFAALLSPLQVGPHVFAAVQKVIPDSIPFQNGVFFLRDFPKLSAGAEADYWIAGTVLGRDTAMTGGLPPTLLGGFYIDWGPPGAIVGTLLVFVALMLLRPARVPSRRSQPTTIAYALVCAYVLTSFYSYISLNVGFIMMLLWCLFLPIARWADGAWCAARRRRRVRHA